MRAIHRVRIGGTNRTPSLQNQLFIGPQPFGKRGGASGNPVDAVCVATGTACMHPLIESMDDDTLIDLARALGHPIDGIEVKRLEGGGVSNEITAHVLIAKLDRARLAAESNRAASESARSIDISR